MLSIKYKSYWVCRIKDVLQSSVTAAYIWSQNYKCNRVWQGNICPRYICSFIGLLAKNLQLVTSNKHLQHTSFFTTASDTCPCLLYTLYVQLCGYKSRRRTKSPIRDVHKKTVYAFCSYGLVPLPILLHSTSFYLVGCFHYDPNHIKSIH